MDLAKALLAWARDRAHYLIASNPLSVACMPAQLAGAGVHFAQQDHCIRCSAMAYLMFCASCWLEPKILINKERTQ